MLSVASIPEQIMVPHPNLFAAAVAAALAREREAGRIQCVLVSADTPSRYAVADEHRLCADRPDDIDLVVWATASSERDGIDPALLA